MFKVYAAFVIWISALICSEQQLVSICLSVNTFICLSTFDILPYRYSITCFIKLSRNYSDMLRSYLNDYIVYILLYNTAII